MRQRLARAWVGAGVVTMRITCLARRFAILAVLPLAGLTAGCGRTRVPSDEFRGADLSVLAGGDELVICANGQGRADLYLASLDPVRLTVITESPEYEMTPAASPDGATVYYAVSEPDTKASIYRLDLADRRPVRVTVAGPWFDRNPSPSPDGKWLRFARAQASHQSMWGDTRPDSWDVFECRTDGSAVRQLTYAAFFQLGSLSHSPDGTKLYFSAAPGVDSEIYELALDSTGALRQLTSGGNSWFAAASPDGRRIAFVSDRTVPYRYEVWTMAADGTDQRQLTSLDAQVQVLAYAPGGAVIYALLERAGVGRTDLVRIRASTGGAAFLAGPSLFARPWEWP